MFDMPFSPSSLPASKITFETPWVAKTMSPATKLAGSVVTAVNCARRAAAPGRPPPKGTPMHALVASRVSKMEIGESGWPGAGSPVAPPGIGATPPQMTS